METPQFAYTSIVFNLPDSKVFGLPAFYYRWRTGTSNNNLTGMTPADQYLRLKQMQNTVRVASSLYIANKASLTVYKKPISDPNQGYYGVCWNQMSDRPIPSVQRATIPTGYNTTASKRTTSVTSSRPGCQTPGGVGCDIKHNSYERYLNRLKGKGPVRRGPVPQNFGGPIPFNRALPVYGGKTMKTSIVTGCDCPIERMDGGSLADYQLYNNPNYQPYPEAKFIFVVGMNVYVKKTGKDYYSKAIITQANEDETYEVEFKNGTSQLVENESEMLIYFPCNCDDDLNPCDI